MEKNRSQWKQFWRKLAKRKTALFGLGIILFYIFIALSAHQSISFTI